MKIAMVSRLLKVSPIITVPMESNILFATENDSFYY